MANIEKTFLTLESGNLQLEQTKLPVFWQNFQIPCVFPHREFFNYFPCAVGTLFMWLFLFSLVMLLTGAGDGACTYIHPAVFGVDFFEGRVFADILQ